MNRITTLAAIALSFAAAGSAFADDITIDHTPFVSQMTRAQVQQELVAVPEGRQPLEQQLQADHRSTVLDRSRARAGRTERRPRQRRTGRDGRRGQRLGLPGQGTPDRCPVAGHPGRTNP
jgi:hypothetical protein